MIKEVELQYTVYNLIKLAKDKYGSNAIECLAAKLQSVITDDQMKVLIDNFGSI